MHKCDLGEHNSPERDSQSTALLIECNWETTTTSQGIGVLYIAVAKDCQRESEV